MKNKKNTALDEFYGWMAEITSKPILETFNETKKPEIMNIQPATPETTLIVREMLAQQNETMLENFKLSQRVEELEELLKGARDTISELRYSSNYESKNDPFSVETESKSELPEELKKVDEMVNDYYDSKVRGTQVFITKSVAKLFFEQMEKDNVKKVQVGRAMMALFINRDKYQRLIVDRAKDDKNLFTKQGKAIKYDKNKSQSFAFTYPVELGNAFNNALRKYNLRQYQVFEAMANEYVSNNYFRRLLPQYEQMAKLM